LLRTDSYKTNASKPKIENRRDTDKRICNNPSDLDYYRNNNGKQKKFDMADYLPRDTWEDAKQKIQNARVAHGASSENTDNRTQAATKNFSTPAEKGQTQPPKSLQKFSKQNFQKEISRKISKLTAKVLAPNSN